MEHQWPVEVVDESGNPFSDAWVTLIPADQLGSSSFPYDDIATNYSDQGGGKYEPDNPIEPVAGNWILIVAQNGRATVVQKLTVTKKTKEEFGCAPRGGAVNTVKITGLTRTVGGSKVKVITFQVKLYPAMQVVFIGGADYHRRDINGGWLFHLYGFHRAEVLRKAKIIHPGTIVTVFSTAKIQRITKVYGMGAWVEVETLQMGDLAARVIPPKPEHYKPAVGVDLHISAFYKHISDAGDRDPGSVKEFGIYSHSWPGGPILYNTYQREPYASGWERDPNDFDARAKDWSPKNLAKYPSFKAALASDCRFTVWGCSATTHYKNRARKAIEAINKGKGEEDTFVVNTELYNDDDHSLYSTTEERTTELRHRYMMDLVFRGGGTYPSAAAKQLGIEVRSACPGCGSDPKAVGGIQVLGVNRVTYAPVFDYYHKKFGPEFAETTTAYDSGYVDYHRLQTRAAVARPGFLAAYYDWSVDYDDGKSELTFWNDKVVTHPGTKGKLKSTAVTDFNGAGSKGWLYVITDKDDTLSRAVYADDDGSIYEVTRDAAKKWTEVGNEI